VPDLDDSLNTFERSVARTDAIDKEVAAHLAERVALSHSRRRQAAFFGINAHSAGQTRSSGFRSRKDADSGAEVALKESLLGATGKRGRLCGRGVKLILAILGFL
jgi:hypothetical protein